VSGGHLCAAEAPTEPTGEIHFLWAQMTENMQAICVLSRQA